VSLEARKDVPQPLIDAAHMITKATFKISEITTSILLGFMAVLLILNGRSRGCLPGFQTSDGRNALLTNSSAWYTSAVQCEPKPAQIISSARSGYDGKNWEGLMKRNYMEVLYLSTSDSSSTVLE
jgi:hypothetical protein